MTLRGLKAALWMSERGEEALGGRGIRGRCGGPWQSNWTGPNPGVLT